MAYELQHPSVLIVQFNRLSSNSVPFLPDSIQRLVR